MKLTELLSKTSKSHRGNFSQKVKLLVGTTKSQIFVEKTIEKRIISFMPNIDGNMTSYNKVTTFAQTRQVLINRI